MSGRYPSPFGPYELLGRLGQGAAGSAHLARPGPATAGVPTPVVIKRLHESVGRQPEFARRFRHEAEIAVLVDSPHVARVFDVGTVALRPYIALEYVPGWTLGRLLGVLHNRGRPPPERVAADAARQFLRGLVALHGARDRRGRALDVVHRDLSPKNLMVGDDGVVRIIDLGLGKSKQQDWKTRAGRVMGSPGYMPPEQITGQPVDQLADVYAAAVVVWELFSAERYIPVGEPVSMLRAALAKPYRPLAELRPDLPPELDAALEPALASEPASRTSSARALLEALDDIFGERSARAAVAEWVRETLPTEQSARRAEVRRLLELPRLTSDDGPEQQATEVWVARDGVVHGRTEVVPPARATRVVTSPESTLGEKAAAATAAGSGSGLDVQVIPAWSRGEWLRLLFALVFGIAIGAVGMRVLDGRILAAPVAAGRLGRSGDGAGGPARPPTGPAGSGERRSPRASSPRVDPRALPSEANEAPSRGSPSVAPAASATPPDAAPLAASERPRTGSARRPREGRSAPPKVRVEPTPASAAPRADRLLDRANRLRRSPSAEVRSAAGRLLSRLTLAARVPDPDARAEQLRGLAKELATLERRALEE